MDEKECIRCKEKYKVYVWSNKYFCPKCDWELGNEIKKEIGVRKYLDTDEEILTQMKLELFKKEQSGEKYLSAFTNLLEIIFNSLSEQEKQKNKE